MAAHLKILMVEDSEDDALLVLQELGRKGYKPTSCRVETRAQMDRALEEGDWDVVLSDHHMPSFSSHAALECLKSSGMDIPFIILSGTMGEELAVEGMKSGAQDYIIKGNLARLVTAIEREVKEAKRRREKRKLEETLQRTRELYAAVVRMTNDILWDMDVVSGKVWWNENLYRVFGYELAPEIHEPSWFYSHIHPDDLERVRSSLTAALSSEVGHWEAEYRFQRADGSYCFVFTRAYIKSESAGRRATGLMIDITERKKLEAQLRQSQKMDAFGQLAGGIAHDFNNLLTAIVSPAALMLDSMAPSDPNRKWAEMIQQAGASATNLVSQLLAFSRQQITRPEVLQLNDVIMGTDKMLGRILGEQFELIMVPEPNLWHVKVDKGQIEQVLVNLAVNARDAMPNGGRIVIETENVALGDTYVNGHLNVPPGDYVLFTVSDTGVGMSPEVQSHLFEPFFTTKEPGKGTGLGLATCFGIVKQAGGHLSVYSELGQGSVFKVFLPRAKEGAKPQSNERDQLLPRGEETVLLVEDDPLVRKLAAALLRQHGYTVIEAHNGIDAIRAIKERRDTPIDLLISDLVMPGMGGRELAEQVSRLSPETKVIFTSGYTHDMTLRQGLTDSEMNFIMKPFTPQKLLGRVRETLDEKAPLRSSLGARR
jgi:two-component system, cell cycle sensor histidine kinase and response regulator CckA